ncbi:MAG: cupin domain-containing protein [Thermoflexibacter sp.]|jgi:quercetin 2,3-dioxygenase|nr:cupin domain-containing protein [Thermoflexibacter sp.]
MKRKEFILSGLAALPVVSVLAKGTTEKTQNKKGFVVKAGQSRFGEQTKIGGLSPNDIKVSTKDTDGQLSVFEYIGKEKGGPPLHVHPKQNEIFFILEGEYLFQVGEEKHQLKAGDTIFLPRNVPHTFAQLTETGKMFFFFQPAGKMEDFFRKMGSLSSAPSPQEGAKIFEAHEMNVVGPPLAY